MYDEYLKEKLMTDPPPKREKTDVELFADKMKPPVFAKSSPLKYLKKISLFQPSSAVKMWINGRKIPPEAHYRLFFCKEFKHWVNEHCIPSKFDEESLTRDSPRLIIPFLDKEGNMFGFQGRSFAKNAVVRYITIILDESMPKLFGIDKVDDKLSHIYVVEGPLDSLFLPNCVASCGSDLTTNLSYITKEKSKLVVVYDNEPRNAEIVKKIEKAIDQGFNVCIWPDTVVEKDINDMVLAGKTSEKVLDTINDNVYNGLNAKLRFNEWKRV
jgi:hypothetical protein